MSIRAYTIGDTDDDVIVSEHERDRRDRYSDERCR